MLKLILRVVRHWKAATRSRRLRARPSPPAGPGPAGQPHCLHLFRVGVLAGAVAMALASATARGQQYPIDGGFEATTADPAVSATGDATHWTKDDSGVGAWFVASTATSRSGSNCIRFQVTGTTGRKLQTKLTKFNTVTSLVVQYYYKNAGNSDPNAKTMGGVKYNGSGTDGPEAGPASNWTKSSAVLSVSGTSGSADFAYVKAVDHTASATTDYYIDDVAVYDGTSVDVTPPDPPTSPSATPASSTSLTVTWTAPATGVDRGGYLVVRGAADPATAPNVNGIYALSNTVAVGQTVVYIGTGTSFTDGNLSTGATYYYRIYTFDKAFNYSTAAGGAAVSGKPSLAAPTAGSDSPICAGNDLHLTASAQAGATYAWTGPNGFSSSAQNPTLAGATTAASGTYSVTVTLSGSTSPAGTTTVTVNAPPTGGADSLSTPSNAAAIISSAKLKANDTGTGLQLTAVTADTGPNCGTVTLSGPDGTVTYTPKAGYSGSDSFTYTLANAQGCTVQVPVSVTVGADNGGSANAVFIGTVAGSFVARFAGIPGCTYTVEINSVPSGPGWTRLGAENFTAPDVGDSHPYGIGVFQVSDPAGSSSRYYRTVWPAY